MPEPRPLPTAMTTAAASTVTNVVASGSSSTPTEIRPTTGTATQVRPYRSITTPAG